MTLFPLLLLLVLIGATLAHEGSQQVAGPVSERSSFGDDQALLDLVQKHMTAFAEELMKQKYGSPPWLKYRDTKYNAEALRQYITMAVNPRSVWHDYYSKNEDRIWNEHEVAVQERDSSRKSIYKLYGITLRRSWPNIIDHLLWKDVENKTLENNTSCLSDNITTLHERYDKANMRAEAMRRFMAEAIQSQSIWETYYNKTKKLLLNNYVTLVEKRDQLWQLLQEQGHEHTSNPVSPASTTLQYNPFAGNHAPAIRPSQGTGNTTSSATPHTRQDACENGDLVCEFLGPNICTEMANYSRENCERTCRHCNASDIQSTSSNITENCSSIQGYDFKMWMNIYKAYQVAVNNRQQDSHRLHQVYHSHRSYDQLNHYSPNTHYHSESHYHPRQPISHYPSDLISHYRSRHSRHYHPRRISHYHPIPKGHYQPREPIRHYELKEPIKVRTESEEEADGQQIYFGSDGDYDNAQSQSNEDRRDYYSERTVDFESDYSSERVDDFEF